MKDKKLWVEICAGSAELSTEANKQGFDTFTIDIIQHGKIDLVTDAINLKIEYLPGIPDVIHISTMCQTYTIAACSTHRHPDGKPKTDKAKFADKFNKHLLNLIKELLVLNPNLIYYIENPRGMLRKMPFMIGIPRATVWYCKYNDIRAKPTDVFSNNIRNLFNYDGWQPRPLCWNGNLKCHHEKAPRGSKTGTQGLKGNYERSKIPLELIVELVTQTKNKIESN